MHQVLHDTLIRRSGWVILAAALALPLNVPSASAKPEIHCDGHEANLAVYLQMHDVLFTQRDGSKAGTYYAEEFISHNHDVGGADAQTRTPAYLERMWRQSKEDSSDRILDDKLILCMGDFVVVHTALIGTRETALAGVDDVVGKTFNYTATDIFRFENGKVVERWGNNDLITMFRQLGFRMHYQGDASPE